MIQGLVNLGVWSLTDLAFSRQFLLCDAADLCYILLLDQKSDDLLTKVIYSNHFWLLVTLATNVCN